MIQDTKKFSLFDVTYYFKILIKYHDFFPTKKSEILGKFYLNIIS